VLVLSRCPMPFDASKHENSIGSIELPNDVHVDLVSNSLPYRDSKPKHPQLIERRLRSLPQVMSVARRR
jgi:hypothetical protein